mmetsp:Transcript_2540/g.3755  ORF Transcript_2540/g.3755 Transcript_2540/m.3755 type:complete len:555 (-) Transcript_2540:162-1826(-)
MVTTVTASDGKKHFIIIGAGASGLTLMRQLTSLGHSVSCFETLPVIGGVYAKSYENTILTTSSLLTAYSEFSDGKEDQPKFWTDQEYLDYLKGYADKFGLFEHINFRTSVLKVQKCPETGKWTAWIKRNRHVPPHRAYGEVPEENPEEPVEEIAGFDGLCICTGTNTWACRPKFDGEDSFKGRIIHSELYNRPMDYEGKKVLVVGAGESGSDICNEISRYADKCGICIRGKHGHIIPRIQKDGRVTDLNTNRCRYSNPYVFGNWIGWATQILKRMSVMLQPETPEKKILCKIGELNLKQKTSAFSKFGCKNAGFVEALVCRNASLHRGNFTLVENGAKFEDGSFFECEEIVACTGYRNSFPFVEETHPNIDEYGQSPRSLYKQIIHPLYNGEVAFFGFARPAFGSIPPTSEMQARFFAMVANGDLKLPEVEKMKEVACVDGKNWEKRYGDDKRVKGLVDFQIYLDDLAKEMGVLPPLKELFFSKPALWFKIMLGPFTVHQYRLRGPGADVEKAIQVYNKQPVGDVLESVITVSFLFVAKVLSILGLSKFTPNNF